MLFNEWSRITQSCNAFEPYVFEGSSIGADRFGIHELQCRRMSTAAGVQAGKRQTIWYFFLLALASLIWSGQGIAVKVLDPHLGPIAITFLPFYVTTLLFVPLLLRLRRQNPGSPAPTARDWVSFTIAGVGGQVLAQLGMTWGISKSWHRTAQS